MEPYTFSNLSSKNVNHEPQPYLYDRSGNFRIRFIIMSLRYLDPIQSLSLKNIGCLVDQKGFDFINWNRLNKVFDGFRIIDVVKIT